MKELIQQYVINNNIRTTGENIEKACIYAHNQGYSSSLGLFCDALVADSELMKILKDGV